MRSILLIACSMFLGCGIESDKSQKHDNMIMDTVYTTNGETDLFYKAPYISLRPDSMFQNSFGLKLNVINNISVSVSNYSKYPVHLRNLKNIQLLNSYPDQGKFSLKPVDSAYQFDICLDFGNGNTLLKYEDSVGFKYKPYDGIRIVGRFSDKVK